jgi:hypothetical protein
MATDHIHGLMEKAERAVTYYRIRGTHPEIPARHAFAWAHGNGDRDANLQEFMCRITRGHSFGYSGTAYGGDDESYHGEGRCICGYCGADGDA